MFGAWTTYPHLHFNAVLLNLITIVDSINNLGRVLRETASVGRSHTSEALFYLLPSRCSKFLYPTGNKNLVSLRRQIWNQNSCVPLPRVSPCHLNRSTWTCANSFGGSSLIGPRMHCSQGPCPFPSCPSYVPKHPSDHQLSTATSFKYQQEPERAGLQPGCTPVLTAVLG